jgi:hypothetical protein
MQAVSLWKSFRSCVRAAVILPTSAMYFFLYRVTINDSFVFKTLFLLCRHFLKALNSCCQLVHTLQTWW